MDIFLALNCLFDVLVVLTSACCTGRKNPRNVKGRRWGKGNKTIRTRTNSKTRKVLLNWCEKHLVEDLVGLKTLE